MGNLVSPRCAMKMQSGDSVVPVQEQVDTLRARLQGIPNPEIEITDALQRRLREWAAEKGVVILDLLDTFVAHPIEETYFVLDGHWNPRGHDLAAAAIATAMEAQLSLNGEPARAHAARSKKAPQGSRRHTR